MVFLLATGAEADEVTEGDVRKDRLPDVLEVQLSEKEDENSLPINVALLLDRVAKSMIFGVNLAYPVVFQVRAPGVWTT